MNITIKLILFCLFLTLSAGLSSQSISIGIGVDLHYSQIREDNKQNSWGFAFDAKIITEYNNFVYGIAVPFLRYENIYKNQKNCFMPIFLPSYIFGYNINNNLLVYIDGCFYVIYDRFRLGIIYNSIDANIGYNYLGMGWGNSLEWYNAYLGYSPRLFGKE